VARSRKEIDCQLPPTKTTTGEAPNKHNTAGRYREQAQNRAMKLIWKCRVALPTNAKYLI